MAAVGSGTAFASDADSDQATAAAPAQPAAAPAPAAPPAAPTGRDDRISISGNGSTLTGTNGGGGGSIGWLHNFSADALAGLAVEHQVLSVANWTFGSINGAITVGPGNARYSFYGEAHEGSGDDGSRHFDYRTEALGVIGTYYHRLSVTLEDKQIDVETTHGNLPKIGLAYLWNPHLNTSLSYSYSVNGNLGTRLTAGRIDVYTHPVNVLAGLSFGQVSPTLLNVVGASSLVIPGQRLREGYAGVSKNFPALRGDLSLIADYQDISGSKRFIGTLNYIFHVGHPR